MSGHPLGSGGAAVRLRLEDLLGPPIEEDRTAERVTRAWRYCPVSDRQEPGVDHPQGWTCGHCLTTSPTAG